MIERARDIRPKRWFHYVKRVVSWFIKEPTFTFVGEQGILPGSMILSNHVSAIGPLNYELYCDVPFRFWGAYQMNGNLREVYAYQTKIYYHQKKHWNLTLARIFCLLASPLTYLFYRGLNLISTYPDVRLMITVKESIKTLKNGHSVLIFPEDSTNGYLDHLKGFHRGFLLLAEQCLKRGMDIPLYVAYFRKRDHRVFVDRPMRLSELMREGASLEEIAQLLCDHCNALGVME